MNCPKCNSDNLTMVGELARCQSCEAYFEPPPKGAPARTPGMIHPATGTRRLAEHFTTAAYIFCVGGGGISGLAILINISSADAASALIALYCLLGCLATAFWLFVLAQIIHIRANLEK